MLIVNPHPIAPIQAPSKTLLCYLACAADPEVLDELPKMIVRLGGFGKTYQNRHEFTQIALTEYEQQLFDFAKSIVRLLIVFHPDRSTF